MTQNLETLITGQHLIQMGTDMYLLQPLSECCTIEGNSYRIWYRSQSLQCKGCLNYGHRSAVHPVHSSQRHHLIITIFKKYGQLSNLDPSPLTIGSTSFATSEYAYQRRACIEYKREDLAERIVHCATSLLLLSRSMILTCMTLNSISWRRCW